MSDILKTVMKWITLSATICAAPAAALELTAEELRQAELNTRDVWRPSVACNPDVADGSTTTTCTVNLSRYDGTSSAWIYETVTLVCPVTPGSCVPVTEPQP